MKIARYGAKWLDQVSCEFEVTCHSSQSGRETDDPSRASLLTLWPTGRSEAAWGMGLLSPGCHHTWGAEAERMTYTV